MKMDLGVIRSQSIDFDLQAMGEMHFRGFAVKHEQSLSRDGGPLPIMITCSPIEFGHVARPAQLVILDQMLRGSQCSPLIKAPLGERDREIQHPPVAKRVLPGEQCTDRVRRMFEHMVGDHKILGPWPNEAKREPIADQRGPHNGRCVDFGESRDAHSAPNPINIADPDIAVHGQRTMQRSDLQTGSSEGGDRQSAANGARLARDIGTHRLAKPRQHRPHSARGAWTSATLQGDSMKRMLAASVLMMLGSIGQPVDVGAMNLHAPLPVASDPDDPNHTYGMVSGPLSWAEAHLACLRRGRRPNGHIVEIETRKEAVLIRSAFGDLDMWIRSSSVESPSSWSVGGPGRLDQRSVVCEWEDKPRVPAANDPTHEEFQAACETLIRDEDRIAATGIRMRAQRLALCLAEGKDLPREPIVPSPTTGIP